MYSHKGRMERARENIRNDKHKALDKTLGNIADKDLLREAHDEIDQRGGLSDASLEIIEFAYPTAIAMFSLEKEITTRSRIHDDRRKVAWAAVKAAFGLGLRQI